MKYSMLLAALLGALGLSACDRPTVVNNPPVATVPVPGPAGPQGEPGRTGAPGATGDTNVTVTTPPATPPATAASEAK